MERALAGERDQLKEMTRMFGQKAALVVVTAAIGVSLLGGAALAAFAPAATGPASLVNDLAGPVAVDNGPGSDNNHDDNNDNNGNNDNDNDKDLKKILDALVAKGVLTQAQEDQILAALKTAVTDRAKEALVRRVYADLFAQSATYLGMTQADLKAKLPGASLGQIADTTAGKTRTGLVAYLNNAVNTAIAKLLADGKVTKEQADKATADAPAHVAKFVDNRYPERKPQPVRAPNATAYLADANKVAREYLGLAEADLNAQLRAGMSLGEIANATAGKNRDGLVAALTQDANTKLDKAKADGKITADQLLQLQSGVSKAINDLVDRKAKTPVIKPNANAAGAAVNKTPKR
jgi:polyhydroxyalkanoate synthesis regulator phasin